MSDTETKPEKNELDVIFPLDIEREVSLVQREGRKVVNAWTEKVVTIKMQFELLKHVSPLLFLAFPNLMNSLVEKGEGDPKSHLADVLKTGIQDAFEHSTDAIEKLLSITLEKDLEWVRCLDTLDALLLVRDWISLNINLFLLGSQKETGIKKNQAGVK